MNFHEKLINLILNNKEKLEWVVGFYNSKIKSNISLSDFGDIDILLEGIDINTQKRCIAIIEVKSNKGLINHYIRKKLIKYVEKFPGAKQFVVYSKNNILDFEDLEFIQIK
jgi:hypothetical protein